MKRIIVALALGLALVSPALAETASPAPAMKGDHMNGSMKADHKKTSMKGDHMKGSMKGDHMKGSMKGDHMKGDAMKPSSKPQ